MTSDRKIKANRANAQASTGPKSRHGRAHLAKNAFRHGLSLPVQSEQVLCEDVQALTIQIAGPHAGAQIQMLARRVAEAQIDLRRVRCARHQLLTRASSDLHDDTRAKVREKVTVMRSLLRRNALEVATAAPAKSATSTPEGPRELATILSQNVKQLMAMDRYERRALSRRKFAIRAFDAALR